jgi:hypothetical protein
MEARLNDTAAMADAGARTAQYKDTLAECLVGGGDVARSREMVLRSTELFEQSTELFECVGFLMKRCREVVLRT